MFLAFALIAAVQAPALPAAEPEKKICKQIAYTGSLMRKRECRTKAEWAAIEEQNRLRTDRALQDGDTAR